VPASHEINAQWILKYS